MSSTSNTTNNNNATTANNNNNNGNQVVCVKRSESSLSAVFEDMYLNERLVDVTINCNNGQLQAHKLVLAAGSPYFSNLFDRLANPYHYPVIVIKDMQIEDLRLIVEFMYKGQLTIHQDRLISLVKCAENLQITGLSNLDESNISRVAANSNGAAIITVEAPRVSHHPRSKRAKRVASSTLNHNQVVFEQTYHHMRVHHHGEIDSRPSPDKLLEQSMITGESMDSSNQQFGYTNTHHASSTKNLSNTSHQHLHAPTTSLQIHNSMSMDQQRQHQHHQHQHQLSNQLQVLSHSLATNRTSVNGQSNSSSSNDNNSNQSLAQQQPHRGRVHPCNICWKTFRERANLKRHLQVHSQDRVMYACLDCNKTFSWKDNYIRHTKTAHHINNARLPE